jgi:hypothetical protein
MPRVCEGCGREYSPKSGKQRFCALGCPGRGRPLRQRGFVPSLRPSFTPERVCARSGCGKRFRPRGGHHRFCSEVCRELVRRPLERATYAVQKRSRARWAPTVAAGRVRCARGAACRFAEGRLGGWIRPGEPWQLGHPDGESVGGPEHVACNAGAPSRLAAERKSRSPSSTSRDW